MKLTVQSAERATQGLFGVQPGDLADVLVALGEKPYRARQVFDWVYGQGVTAIDAMANLPRGLRTALAARFHLFESTIVTDQTARDATRKLLLRWSDGATSECVLIPDGARRTACISTQVGCPVGCTFCASGIDGLQRNLTTAQIVEQAMRIRQLCAEENARLSNVVFMGLGEPLANYASAVSAVRLINHDRALNIAARKITVSTVGLPTQMRRLADEGLQITLALSLHAPTDGLRAQIIPWAERVGLDELIAAARHFFEKTGREVTLEYVLLGGVNDQATHAEGVADICRRMRANVNLIRFNPVPDLPFARPTADAAQQFLTILRARGVNTHLRRSRGMDIDGACGQLRRRTASPTP
jgi:23S rRNA (adenine2503-C2)-methyltransferase